MKSANTIVLLLILVFSSCKKEDNSPSTNSSLDFRTGIWVSNEGSFMQANAEVSVLGIADTPIIEGFRAANGYEVGDVLQSIYLTENKAYLVVNNSQKVEVVDQKSMESIGVIAPCSYPRYFVQLNDQTGYISNGSGSGEVLIVILESLEVIGQIPVGNGPEAMQIIGDYLFVVNSGGWLEDNSVSVINTLTNQETQRITVGDRPVKLTLTADGMLQVLCAGKIIYDENWNIVAHSAAGVYAINPMDFTATLKLSFDDVTIHPTVMTSGSAGAELYIALEEELKVYNPLVSDDYELIRTIDQRADAILVDDANSQIWLTQIVDYSTAGKVLKLTEEGTVLQEITVGIAPNGIYAGSAMN